MKLFLNITIFYAILFSSTAMAKKISHLISVGNDTTCAFGEGQGKCWIDNREYSLSIGAVKQITSNSEGLCAIIEDQIKCLSSTDIIQKRKPQIIEGIKSPEAILASTSKFLNITKFCAIDKGTVKCWEIGDTAAARPRQLTHRTYKKADLFMYTKLDNCPFPFNLCLSGEQQAALLSLELNSPVNSWEWRYGEGVCGVSLKGGYICIDKDGAKVTPSWGEDIILNSRNCYLFNSHVECVVAERLEKVAHKIDTAVLKNPRIMTNSYTDICILDDEGVKCWGEGGREDHDLGPSMKAPNFGLNELPHFLNEISKGSSLIKTKFYGNLSEYVSKELSKNTENMIEQFTQKAAQYTIASLLASSIKDGDSEYYLINVSPSYKESMSKIEMKTGLTGLSSVPDLSATRKAALKVIHAALSVIDNFLTSSEKERMQFTLRLLGQALAAPSNSDAIHSLLNDLSEMEDIFTKLSRSRKAAFLITTLNEAVEFLNGKTGY